MFLSALSGVSVNDFAAATIGVILHFITPKAYLMLNRLRVACAVCFCLLTAAACAQKTINVPSDQPTIQAGVNAANAGDTVLVQPGTYQENVVINKAITLTSSACAGNNAPANCNTQTTIDGSLGGGTGGDITVSNVLSLKTTISGLSLINANSSRIGDAAGVELDNAGATITNNIFSTDNATVLLNTGAIDFTNNQVVTAASNGTTCRSENGLYLTGTNTMVLDNYGSVAATVITGNSILGGGKCIGGIGINDQLGSDIYIGDNTISGQSQAIIVQSSSAHTYIYNNLITGNSSGGVTLSHQTNAPAADPADTFLMNNTFVNNLSGVKGLSGAVGPAEVSVSGTFSQVALINNIFSTNSATNPILDCAGTPSSTSNQITPIILDHNLFYNSATNGKLGADGCPVPIGSFGNINVNPNFVSATNFQLAAGSPAIDAGNNSFYLIYPISGDLLGNARIQNGVVDMGAYETNVTGGALSGFTEMQASSSSYYLVSGNTFTVSAQLSYVLNGISTTHLAGQPVTFTTANGVTPVTVITDSNGNASVPYKIATPGLYPFVVSYAGGAFPAAVSVVIYVYVTSPLAVTTLTLGSSKSPSLVGQSVTFTVTSNSSDGTHPSPVVLADGGTTLAVLSPTSGTSTYTTSALIAGQHPLTASFAGDAAHTAATANFLQLVGNYTPTTTVISSSQNPSVFSQSVTLTAHVSSSSGVPTGSVVFLDGTTQLGSAVTLDGNGNATYMTSTFAVGNHDITANYTATGAYANSTGMFTQTVNGDPTQAVLVVAPTMATYGTTVTMTATVSALPPYGGTGIATGTVTFFDGATTLGTASISATTSAATFMISTLSGGTHNINCTYNGAANYATSNCTAVIVTITPATTAMSIGTSATPSPALTPITFTAHLTAGGQPAAAGSSVVFTITTAGGSAASYNALTNATGTATYTSSGLAAGSYTVTAGYTATTNYTASSAALTQVVNANATSTTLIAAPNPGIQNNPVTLAATVAALAGAAPPVGSVAFLDGTTTLQTISVTPGIGSVLSSASLTTSLLSPGTHSLTAVFTPSTANFTGSTSATLTLPIAPQDFTFTGNPAAITIQTQHHATLQLTLSSIGGFAAPITITCGALPQYLTCEPPAAPVTLPANGNSTVNVTLDTDVLLNFVQIQQPASHRRAQEGIALASLLPLALLGLARKRRKLQKFRPFALLAILFVASFTMTACSGKQPASTPPGTYSIAITATGTTAGSAAPTTHTLNVTLTVTP